MISRIFFSMAAKSSGGEGLVAEEVVVEAVLDHRADGHLRAGEQLLHRLGQHMGAVVADEFERLRIVARDDAQRRIGDDRIGEIDKRAVHDGGNGLLLE